MHNSDVIELVSKIQQLKAEFSTVEVKKAKIDCPKRLYDTLSSFSNQDQGGIIVFGLDEDNNFEVNGVYDAQDIQKQINNQCKEMEPVVRPLITVVDIQGKAIVTAEIPPIEIINRPCYYKGKGKTKGSYTRSGDSDELMTEYEIYSYEAYRQKYQDDIRIIERASNKVIDLEKVQGYRNECKKNKPNFAKINEDSQINELMSITRDGKLTLATVMLFGIYPQAFFPQLSIIATVIPGVEDGMIGQNGERFLDNKRIEGSIAEMLDGAIQFIKNNMRTSTIIDPTTGKREDRTDYPLTAVREIILNALVHRDYSVHTEGMPIQIKMYEDRMEVKNPGGLYGRLRVDQLGKTQPDTRNPVLATALEILNLTENRYSGIPTIRMEMQNAGSPEPVFMDERGTFTVVLYKRNYNLYAKGNTEEAILEYCKVPRTRTEIAGFLNISTPSYAINKYIKPLISEGKMGITNHERPNSPYQKFYTITK